MSSKKYVHQPANHGSSFVILKVLLLFALAAVTMFLVLRALAYLLSKSTPQGPLLDFAFSDIVPIDGPPDSLISYEHCFDPIVPTTEAERVMRSSVRDSGEVRSGIMIEPRCAVNGNLRSGIRADRHALRLDSLAR